MPITTPFISDRVNAKLRNVVERFMTSLADVQRGSNPGVRSGYNQPGKPTAWPTYLADVKCDVTQSTTILTGEQQSKDTAMIVGRLKFTFPYGTDITVADRIVNLRDRDGNLVDASVNFYDVKELIPDDTSLTVLAQAVH
jgi:hypothetical protein